MPFKDAAAKAAWRQARATKNRAEKLRHFEKKAGLGISRSLPLDDLKRAERLQRRADQEEYVRQCQADRALTHHLSSLAIEERIEASLIDVVRQRQAGIYVSQAEYARMRGTSKKRITIWKQGNLIVFNDRGLVDVTSTDDKLAHAGKDLRWSGVYAGTAR